ncbi:MAG: hypothetical protein SFW35_01860 [Chitinophagales bacterium]|nr:hypothetical protein [Chitinophagales bacterium]
MWEKLSDYLLVYLGSMFKMILGPLAGLSNHLTLWETALFTCLGMMSTVLVISLINPSFRKKMVWKFKRDKRLFTRRNRRLVLLWRKYGLKGIAFITPVLLMPIGGAIIALSFGGKRKLLYQYMFASMAFWSLITSWVVLEAGQYIR